MLFHFCAFSVRFGSRVWSKVRSSHKKVCPGEKDEIHPSLEGSESKNDFRSLSTCQGPTQMS